jgi:2-phospho-L-lactate guanylyltransferase
MTMVTVIPVKGLRSGKSRLATVLDACEREQLCTWMLERTLELTASMECVWVVSDDLHVAKRLKDIRSEARFLSCSPPPDLNAALDVARAQVPIGAAMLILPTDLILLQRNTLQSLVSAPSTLSIGSNAARRGTNILLLPATAVQRFRFCFGEDSFRKHVEEAQRLGFEPQIVRSAETETDLDTSADLETAADLNTVQFPFFSSKRFNKRFA